MPPARRPAGRAARAAPARRRRRPCALLLCCRSVVGLFGAPGTTPTSAATSCPTPRPSRQQLKKQVAAQKAQVAALNALQAGLAAEIRETKRSSADRRRPDRGQEEDHEDGDQIEEVQADLRRTSSLQLRDGRRARRRDRAGGAKRDELSERRALLADRVRNAYDTDRTSPLETFLSGGDVHGPARRDELLHRRRRAGQGARHADHQGQGDAGRDPRRRSPTRATGPTSCARRRRPRSVRSTAASVELKETKAAAQAAREEGREGARAAEGPLRRARPQQGQCRQDHRQAAADQKQLAREIDSLIAKQVKSGNIPSQFNGTMRWPMDNFTISGEYGCSSYEYYAPGHGCAHYHNGIDLVGPPDRPVRAAGAGMVVVRRLELGGRRRPGVDRGHRPLIRAAELVRPHEAGLPVPRGADGGQGRHHRSPGQHREFDRGAPPLDGGVQAGPMRPVVPVGTGRRASIRPLTQ